MSWMENISQKVIGKPHVFPAYKGAKREREKKGERVDAERMSRDQNRVLKASN